jgi:hypothetical protein
MLKPACLAQTELEMATLEQLVQFVAKLSLSGIRA